MLPEIHKLEYAIINWNKVTSAQFEEGHFIFY